VSSPSTWCNSFYDPSASRCRTGSRETTDADRPIARAIRRTPQPAFTRVAISILSATDSITRSATSTLGHTTADKKRYWTV
jgi:hypothetical protein